MERIILAHQILDGNLLYVNMSAIQDFENAIRITFFLIAFHIGHEILDGNLLYVNMSAIQDFENAIKKRCSLF